jgi:integrase
MGVKVREKVEGSGVWWVFVNHNGKRSSKRVGSEKAANKVKEMIEARVKLDQYLPSQPRSIPTLKEYYQAFSETYMETSIRESTRASYKGSFRRHILPALENKRLDEIDRGVVERFIAELMAKKRPTVDGPERGLAKDSIRVILASLRILLSNAREKGIIQVNPVSNVGKLYRQASKMHEEIQPLTAAEVPGFLQAVQALYPTSLPIFLLALHTGLRSGELNGLQWGDIDFNGKYVVVRRAIVRGQESSTKTNRIRRVDLSDAALFALEALRRTRQEEWLAKGQNEIPKWVFCNEEGRWLDFYHIKKRHLQKSLMKAKLRQIRFHDLRHTFASLLIQNGESLAYVKDQLGHSSIKMTVDVYGHLVPGANRQAVNRLPSLGDTNNPAALEAAAGQKNLV